jgi:hypothetical protein
MRVTSSSSDEKHNPMNIPHTYSVAEAFFLIVLQLTVKVFPPVLLSGFGFIGLLFMSFGSKVASRLYCALFGLLTTALSAFIIEIYAVTAMVWDWWADVQAVDDYHEITGIREYRPTQLGRVIKRYQPAWWLSFGLHVASYLLFLWAACELVVNSSIWATPTAFATWGPFLFLVVPAGTIIYAGLTSSRIQDFVWWLKH